ncbi:MAG: DNA cytosine methyltransferase [Methylobacterium radiotolerans]
MRASRCTERGRRFRAVDLYCGSGAVTAGLVGTFDVVAAVDNDELACRTYEANHPGVRLFRRDIRSMDPTEILAAVPSASKVDLLVVCAPCQPFSNQNRNRSGDPRASLVLQAARFAAVLRPRGILFENVPGLAGNSGVYQALTRELAAVGYVVGAPRRINAADLGVPQRRVRCVMFASPSIEAVERFSKAELSAPKMTVADAIGDLLPLESGERDPDDAMHAARRHSPLVLRRLRAVPP